MEKSSFMEYKVGAFVALGLVALMISILILGGNRVVFTHYLKYHTDFGEVQGLFPGSVVSLAGLPVGNVKEIHFATGSNQLEVVYQVDLKYQSRVTNGTTAQIRTQGALGDKYVYLEPGLPTAPAIADNAEIPLDRTADLFTMLASKEDGAGNILALIKELKVLIQTMNANGRTEKIMDNMVKSSAQLEKTLVQLDTLVTDIHKEIPNNQKIRSAVNDLASIMNKIDHGQGTLGQMINDPSVYQGIKGFLGGSPRNTYLKNVIRETIQTHDQNEK
jgi:phospholipid/cholesterol/gamma-HCH transport system substrate-binding protein